VFAALLVAALVVLAVCAVGYRRYRDAPDVVAGWDRYERAVFDEYSALRRRDVEPERALSLAEDAARKTRTESAPPPLGDYLAEMEQRYQERR
jgi:hypothetical protein